MNAKRRLWNYKLGMDLNGNHVLRIVPLRKGERGFSIQTNGNLPDVHSNGITERTDAEVCAFVGNFGTDRQRQILGM